MDASSDFAAGAASPVGCSWGFAVAIGVVGLAIGIGATAMIRPPDLSRPPALSGSSSPAEPEVVPVPPRVSPVRALSMDSSGLGQEIRAMVSASGMAAGADSEPDVRFNLYRGSVTSAVASWKVGKTAVDVALKPEDVAAHVTARLSAKGIIPASAENVSAFLSTRNGTASYVVRWTQPLTPLPAPACTPEIGP